MSSTSLDVLAAVADLERSRGYNACRRTRHTAHVHVWQEVHFTRITPSPCRPRSVTLDVKLKRPES